MQVIELQAIKILLSNKKMWNLLLKECDELHVDRGMDGYSSKSNIGKSLR